MPTKTSRGQNSHLGHWYFWISRVSLQHLLMALFAVYLFLCARSNERIPCLGSSWQSNSQASQCPVAFTGLNQLMVLSWQLFSEQLVGDLIGVCNMQPTSWYYLDMQQLITNSQSCYPCPCHYLFSDWFPMKLIKILPGRRYIFAVK